MKHVVGIKVEELAKRFTTQFMTSWLALEDDYNRVAVIEMMDLQPFADANDWTRADIRNIALQYLSDLKDTIKEILENEGNPSDIHHYKYSYLAGMLFGMSMNNTGVKTTAIPFPKFEVKEEKEEEFNNLLDIICDEFAAQHFRKQNKQ